MKTVIPKPISNCLLIQEAIKAVGTGFGLQVPNWLLYIEIETEVLAAVVN
jgi:hypothetical protein